MLIKYIFKNISILKKYSYIMEENANFGVTFSIEQTSTTLGTCGRPLWATPLSYHLCWRFLFCSFLSLVLLQLKNENKNNKSLKQIDLVQLCLFTGRKTEAQR
jgi:hypothetical protein